MDAEQTDELAGLVRAVRCSPDPTPAMVLADWLEEHGRADHADQIRVGIEYSRFTRPSARMDSGTKWGREDGPTHDDIEPRLLVLERSVTDERLRERAASYPSPA